MIQNYHWSSIIMSQRSKFITESCFCMVRYHCYATLSSRYWHEATAEHPGIILDSKQPTVPVARQQTSLDAKQHTYVDVRQEVPLVARLLDWRWGCVASKDSANKPNLFSHPWLAVDYLRWNKHTHSEEDFYMSFRLFNVHSTGLLSIQKEYSG